MRNQTILSLAAASVACTLLAGALWADRMTSMSLMVLAIGFAICVLVYWLAPKFKSPIYDPYDLRLLKEIDERESEEPVAEDELPDGEYSTTICRCCSEVYDCRLAVCPHCGRSQY